MIIASLILAAIALPVLAHFGSIAILLIRTRPGAPHDADRRPPVSIVRPVCGIENYVEETLASTFGIDYPDFSVLKWRGDNGAPVRPFSRLLSSAKR
jgi:ceramide glucosyltransferase